MFEAAVSLVGNPKLENPEDQTRKYILESAEAVAEKDPEFVLKVNTTSSQILSLNNQPTHTHAHRHIHTLSFSLFLTLFHQRTNSHTRTQLKQQLFEHKGGWITLFATVFIWSCYQVFEKILITPQKTPYLYVWEKTTLNSFFYEKERKNERKPRRQIELKCLFFERKSDYFSPRKFLNYISSISLKLFRLGLKTSAKPHFRYRLSFETNFLKEVTIPKWD